MAGLILPSKRTSQPQQVVGIDWANPLTKGLVGSYTPIDAGVSVGGASSIVGNIVPDIGSAGRAWKGDYQASDNYVLVPKTAAYSYTQQVTFEALISVKAFQTNVFPYISGIIGQFQNVGAIQTYGPVLRFNNDATIGSAAHIGFCILQGGTEYWAVSSTNLNTNTLYHILGTYDGTQIRLYVNGQNVATTTLTGAFDNDPANFISIGSEYVVSALNHNRCLNGNTYLARIYNVGKTDAEAKSLADNPWRIFKPQQRRLWVVPASSGAIGLAGDAGSSTTATGAVTTSLNVSGSAAAKATDTGAVIDNIPIVGETLSVSSATGTLIENISLDANARSLSSITGAFGVNIPLSGSSASVSSEKGTATLSLTLSGNDIATAAALGNSTLSIALSGLALSAALTAANISIDGVVSLSGSASANSAATSSPSIYLPLIGSSKAYASATGNIATILNASGISQSVSKLTGDLTVAVNTAHLLGNMPSGALAGAMLNISIQLSGAELASAIEHCTISGLVWSAFWEKYRIIGSILKTSWAISGSILKTSWAIADRMN